MPPKQSNVFVVYERDATADITFAGAYTKQADADAEAKKLRDDGKPDVAVEKMSLDANAGKKGGGKAKATAASKKGRAKSMTPANDGDDQDEGAEDEDEAPAKPKKTAKKAAAKDGDDAKAARKVFPEGEDGSCEGLKLLFTGTMSLDRTTMEATAIMYGGEIVKKLEDTDWIILGTRPGDNKVKEINEKGLKTMSEDDFFEMVKGGGEPAESAGPPKKKLKA